MGQKQIRCFVCLELSMFNMNVDRHSHTCLGQRLAVSLNDFKVINGFGFWTYFYVGSYVHEVSKKYPKLLELYTQNDNRFDFT